MALEPIFQQLDVRLHKLYDALKALHLTTGDTPANDVSALAEGREHLVFDMLGTLHEAKRFALQACKAVGEPDLDLARKALTRCHERFHRVEQMFANELASYEKMREVTQLGAERRVWQAWVDMVKIGIEHCRDPLELVNQAIAECWGELAERLGLTSISVRNHVVGQKVVTREPRVRDEFIERVT
jgi:hypothetical protein